MDKQQFSKWLSVVENAMNGNSPMAPELNNSAECGCQHWNCQVCFPSDSQELSVELPVIGEENADDDNWYAPAAQYLGSEPEEAETIGDHDYQDAWDMISIIKDAQMTGTTSAEKNYSEDELGSMSMPELRAVYKSVTGTDVLEAEQKLKSRPKFDFDPLDGMDDILSPKNLPSVVDNGPDSDAGNNLPAMPTASASTTRQKTAGIGSSDTMRDYMSRINPEVGNDEPELATTDITLRTASDVPAVISNAMAATGTQTPEWHTIDNLPGFMQRAIRGMGRKMFGMITNTPLEKIQTVANVEGRGPNSDAEMRAIAGWLSANAEDLGPVDVSHGMAIPGYEPEVREFRANGVRFHVVRDPMGQYIYAYPDRDAKIGGKEQQQNIGENLDNFREFLRPSLMEQLKWDEEIDALLKEEQGVELEESTLSRLIGKQKGGQRLVQWLHRKHKLSNEAELEPVNFTKELLWTQFKKNPDDFVIVSGTNGVAGIKPSEKHIEAMRAAKAKKGQDYNPARDATLPYQIIAFTDDGEQVDPELLRPTPEPGDKPEVRDTDPTVMRARMGKSIGKDIQNSNNTFALLQQQIGQLRSVWISGWSGYRGTGEDLPDPAGSVERGKMKKRADLKKVDVLSPEQATSTVFKKIKPVLSTVVNQALSHVMRRMQRFVEGGNFEGATKLSRVGENLKKMLATIDTSRDINLDASYGSPTRELANAMQSALRDAYNQSGAEGESYDEFLDRIAKSNSAALRPILDSVRKSILS